MDNVAAPTTQTRVSPAITFQFEQIAGKVCDLANVDYDDRTFVIRELLNHLQTRWRGIISHGKHTDSAASVEVLLHFGEPKDIARAMRGGIKGYFRRLLTYHRYQSARSLVIVVTGLLVDFFRDISSLKLSGDTPGAYHVALMWYGTGIFYGAFIIACIALAKHRNKGFIGISFSCGAFFLYCVIFAHWIETLANYKDKIQLFNGAGYQIFELSSNVFLAPLLGLCLVCMVQDLFTWPLKKPLRKVYS